MSDHGNGMSEAKILVETRLAASDRGFVLWRNNVGTGWVGNPIEIPAGSVIVLPNGVRRQINSRALALQNPRPLHAGLCEGSSDLIGFRRITITPEMAGESVPVFAAIEVKTPTGRVSREQQKFMDFIRQSGGISRVVRSDEDLK